jgi:hypothetical protein
MLGDILHFGAAPLQDNRERDYRVIELYLNHDGGKPGGLTVVESRGEHRFWYSLSDEDLVTFGAQIIFWKHG